MKRGLALILVVGVLAVLAVLGSAFAVLSRLERRAADQRVQSTHALLLARSGMEDALARCDLWQDAAYGGEDWDADGGLNGIEIPAEVYHSGILDTAACPVKQALRPSFFVKDPSSLDFKFQPAPKRVRAEGRERGYSGRLSAGTWAIKAVPAGGFPVNGGDVSFMTPTTTTDLNTCLRRMFGTLAEAIDREDGTADSLPVGKTDGQNLIAMRPLTGWSSFEQIRTLALGGSQAKLDALKDYLVLSAWSDRKVIAPNVLTTAVNKSYRLMTTLGVGAWLDSGAAIGMPTRCCPDFERRPRTRPGIHGGARILGRPPVDLAWARTRRPALIALLANLKGCFLQEFSWVGDPLSSLCKTLPVQITLDWAQPSDDCRTVADALLGSASELGTWDQFGAFCDALPFTDGAGATMVTDLGQAKKDLLKANFNPNTDANKFNPEASLRKLVDKSDLLLHTLEFNLSPRGAWSLSVVGRSPRATRLVSARTEDRLFRLTTQGELVAGNLGDPDVAGDESDFRNYGRSPYIPASSGTKKTFGHTFPLPCPPSGISLQTYPEPQTVWNAGFAPAYWDGQLKLATVETAADDYLQGGGSLMFLARFDDAFDADVGAAKGLVPTDDPGMFDPWGGANGDFPPPPEWTVWPDIDGNTDREGTLYPCGAYVEQGWAGGLLWQRAGSAPGYAALGNMPSDHATVSFWYKPANDTRKLARVSGGGTYLNDGGWGPYFCNSRFYNGTWSWQPAPPYQTEVLSFGNWNWQGGYPVGENALGFAIVWQSCLGGSTQANAFDTGPSSDVTRDVQVRITPLQDVLPRWTLQTYFWDMRTARPGGGIDDPSARILINRGLDASERNIPSWSYAGAKAYPCTGNPCDFTEYKGGSASFHLTERLQHDQSSREPCPTGTFDELAIYDFGLATLPTTDIDGIDLSQDLAADRFVAGRYYKESEYTPGAFRNLPVGPGRRAGEWFSAPVDLGDLRIRTLSWTQIVPRGLKSPEGAVPEDGDAGPDARIAFELTDSAGTEYASPGFFTDSRGERLDRRIRAPFRFHAVFQPNLDSPDDRAILDPLALDDVSVSYRRLDQAWIRGWSEGE